MMFWGRVTRTKPATMPILDWRRHTGTYRLNASVPMFSGPVGAGGVGFSEVQPACWRYHELERQQTAGDDDQDRHATPQLRRRCSSRNATSRASG